MSEVAFSLERKLEINKTQIRSWQHQSLITDKTKFECLDPKCKIPMSCACWEENGQYKREPYFYPTFKKEHPHVFNCNYVSEKEIQESIITEVEQVYEAQQIKTEIVLGNPKVHSIFSANPSQYTDNAEGINAEKFTNKTVRTQTTELSHKEQSTWFRNLGSFVSMFHDPKINNQAPLVLNFSFDKRDTIETRHFMGVKDISSFSRFFHQISTDNVPLNRLQVFYGKAKIIKINKTGLCKIVFSNKPYINLPFNINQVPRNSFLKKIVGNDSDIDHLKEVMVYFEGAMTFVEKKRNDDTIYRQLCAIPLTKEFYRSLYFEKI